MRALKLLLPAAVVLAGILAWLLPPAPLMWIADYVLVNASFWGALAFTGFYTLLAPWWRNPMGKLIVAIDCGVVLALMGGVLRQDFHAVIPELTLLRVTAFALALVAGTILSRIWLLGTLHSWKLTIPWRHRRDHSSAG
jgi:hypothetical protein